MTQVMLTEAERRLQDCGRAYDEIGRQMPYDFRAGGPFDAWRAARDRAETAYWDAYHAVQRERGLWAPPPRPPAPPAPAPRTPRALPAARIQKAPRRITPAPAVSAPPRLGPYDLYAMERAKRVGEGKPRLAESYGDQWTLPAEAVETADQLRDVRRRARERRYRDLR